MSTDFKQDYIAPNFIGIGMERAGTSWLFTQIAAHPDIWVPPLKEIHFFDVIDPKAKYLTHRYSYHLKSRIKQKAAPLMDMQFRPEFYKNSFLQYLLWDFYFFTGKFDINWYKRLFHPRFTEGKVCGEITPAYSNLTPQTIAAILNLNPDMKFILMVRNPIRRIWSGLVHHFRHVEGRDFDKVSEQEMLDFLKHSAAQNRSDLTSILETWEGHVSSKNLLIQPFEDIADRPETLIKNTYEFLGVDSNFLPDADVYKKRINAYTQYNYGIPQSIIDYLVIHCREGLEKLGKSYPYIIQRWNDSTV